MKYTVLGLVGLGVIVFMALIMKIGDNVKKNAKSGKSESSTGSEVTDAEVRLDVSKQYFDQCKRMAKVMRRYLDSLQSNSDFIDFLQYKVKGVDVFDSFDGSERYNPRLFMLFFCDLMTVYKNLGHDTDLNNKEILCPAILYAKIISSDFNPTYDTLESYRGILAAAASALDCFPSMRSTDIDDRTYLYLVDVIEKFNPEMTGSYHEKLYQFANIVASTDGVITSDEADYIECLKPKSEVATCEVNNSSKTTDSAPVEQPVPNIDDLVGLESVKTEIKKLTNFIKVNQFRQKEGLRTAPISYHCVFTGNPGTGKTTAARIIASIYRDLGILAKGHLVETDRSGLVAEYVGQTAVKTNKIIDSALDGVLFIDEAYSLVQGSSSDFGIEAISTLLKRMEDDRDRLVVILAGYGDEMKTFIDANPGLESRFNRYINFEDYTADELVQIFESNVAKNDYIITTQAYNVLKSVIDKAVAQKDKNFGNARFVRNLFEKTLENQAMRLASLSDISKEMLQTLTDNDIPVE